MILTKSYIAVNSNIYLPFHDQGKHIAFKAMVFFVSSQTRSFTIKKDDISFVSHLSEEKCRFKNTLVMAHFGLKHGPPQNIMKPKNKISNQYFYRTFLEKVKLILSLVCKSFGTMVGLAILTHVVSQAPFIPELLRFV